MNLKNLLIILIIILIIVNYKILDIYKNDIFFGIRRLFYKIEYNNNKNNFLITKEPKILIISFDNRKNLNYLDIHNQNIINYCKKWKNINYEFIDKCDKNVYWCKLYILLEKLLTNKYDYVMWMDSDTKIVNTNFSIQKFVNSYSSDIFIGHDDNNYINNLYNILNVLCSGVFIIKNSTIGINFIKDCLDYYEKSNCNTNNKLNGIYANLCYEQGVMNYYIFEKYMKSTTIVDQFIFKNTYNCDYASFILHKYGSNSDENTYNCFIKNN